MSSSERHTTTTWFVVVLITATLFLMSHVVCHSSLTCTKKDASSSFHTIQVIDKMTQRGIPMVNLTTVNLVNYYTDSNGVVAYYEPGLMNRTVYFTLVSDGYEYEKDMYGFTGVAIQVVSGAKTVLQMTRQQIGQRLYRASGEGIYRDSVLTEEPIADGKISMEFAREKYLVNSDVLGLDSVMICPYKSRIYAFYGDTLRTSYPLGNFHATGAIIDPRMNIEYGLNITYFTKEDGFVKSVAPVEPLSYPTWIHDVVSLKDDQGQEHMFATYYKPYGELVNDLTARIPDGKALAKMESNVDRGLLKWKDSIQQFEKIASIQPYTRDHIWPVDGGHPLFYQKFVYFGQPYPMVRCLATAEGYLNLQMYEAFSCLKEGTTVPSDGDLSKLELDRTSGRLTFAWKVNTSPLTVQQLQKLIEIGLIKQEEAYFLQLRSVDNPSEYVTAAAGTVYWNEFRQRFIMIAQQVSGSSSFLGEIWYSEADLPEGPWIYAKKIVTHNKRDFYNPLHHKLFDADNGRIIYFEGTYVNTFDKEHPTPRYNYNQQMYKLDLQDVTLPVAIYGYASTRGTTYSSKILSEHNGYKLLFYAFDKQVQGTIPVYQNAEGDLLSEMKSKQPAFYAWPKEYKQPVATFLLTVKGIDQTTKTVCVFSL